MKLNAIIKYKMVICLLLLLLSGRMLAAQELEPKSVKTDRYHMSVSFSSKQVSSTITNSGTWTVQCIMTCKKSESSVLVSIKDTSTEGIIKNNKLDDREREQICEFFNRFNMEVVTDIDTGVTLVKEELIHPYYQLVADAINPPMPPQDVVKGGIWDIKRDSWNVGDRLKEPNELSSGIRPACGIYEKDVSYAELYGINDSTIANENIFAKYTYNKGNNIDWYGLNVYYNDEEKRITKCKLRQWRSLNLDGISEAMIVIDIEYIDPSNKKSGSGQS